MSLPDTIHHAAAHGCARAHLTENLSGCVVTTYAGAAFAALKPEDHRLALVGAPLTIGSPDELAALSVLLGGLAESWRAKLAAKS